VHTYLFNVEPSTFRFLEDVLQEVMTLFPSSYIHVGGDEAVKDQWKASPSVQARMRTLGISDPEALQTWFTQEIGRYLVAHGRKLVGWDEILRPGLPTNALVMSWRGVEGAHAAAVAGNDTVLSPWPTLYFDNQQSPLMSEPPGRLRVISLEDVYKFEPRDATLTADQQKHVLGVQANIWTEHIRTEDRVQWMALPRAAALAEVGWTAPERRNWNGFVQRLPAMLERYRAFGIHAADSLFGVDAKVMRADKEIQVTFASQGGVGDIRYTVNGHDPSAQSTRYSGSLRVPLGKDLRAATFVGDAPVSQVWRRMLDPESLAKRTSRELDLCGDAISLLLEPNGYGAGERPIYALDLMNPCWIYRGVDLTRGAKLVASVGKLPFNFEIGEAAQKIRVGDARSTEGELEVRIDDCDGEPVATKELTAVPDNVWTKTLPQIRLPPRAGRHDVCLRFARPKLDPMWALDWVRIAP
jgi:hexosaminidase